MRITLNLTENEAECLTRMIDRYMTVDLSGAPAGTGFQFACKPLLQQLRDKIKVPPKITVSHGTK